MCKVENSGLTIFRPHMRYTYGMTMVNRLHDDVIKWKHFLRYWPFVRGIHRSQVNSLHKGQWRGALMFSLLGLNKRLSKQSWGWWFETLSSPLWRHCNGQIVCAVFNTLVPVKWPAYCRQYLHMQCYFFTLMEMFVLSQGSSWRQVSIAWNNGDKQLPQPMMIQW